MTTNTTPQIQNLIDLGSDGWLVKLFVPPTTLRLVSGFEVTAAEERQDAPGRHNLVKGEKGEWLPKFFGCIVPKREGVYNLTAWGGTNESTGETHKPSSMQVRVTGNGARAKISKLGYAEALAEFGVTAAPAPQSVKGKVGSLS